MVAHGQSLAINLDTVCVLRLLQRVLRKWNQSNVVTAIKGLKQKVPPFAKAVLQENQPPDMSQHRADDQAGVLTKVCKHQDIK